MRFAVVLWFSRYISMLFIFMTFTGSYLPILELNFNYFLWNKSFPTMYLSESLVWMNGIMEPLPLIWLVVWTFWIDATNQWASSIRLGRCWPLVLEKPSLQWFCLSNLMLNKVNSTLLFHYTCTCYSWGFSHPLCFPIEWLKNHDWIAKMIITSEQFY